MTIEMQYLAWTVVLGFVYVMAPAQAKLRRDGLAAAAGNRENQQPSTGVIGRLERAARNFLETLPFFIIGVVLVHMASQESSLTRLGVELYFWARVAYLPIYAIGIPYLRTLVWGVSIVGIGMLVYADLAGTI